MPQSQICSPTEAAYIAGFFDGEGSINITNKGQVRVVMSQKKPEVLYWIRDTLGGGTVRQLTKRGEAYECWRYGVYSIRQVCSFLDMVLPYVVVKRREVMRARELMKIPGRQRIGLKIRG